MIKNLIKKLGGQKETAQPHAASPQPQPKHKGEKKNKTQSTNKANKKPANKSKPSHKRSPDPSPSAQPAWNINDFVVAEQEGKTRFHDFQLHDELMHGIHELGFSYCTPVQAQTLPFTLKGQDIIGKAQTGTGKTAAFLISIIDQLLCHPLEGARYHAEPRALIIAPTRELVHQIAKDAEGLCRFTGLHIVNLVGGEPHEKQQKQLAADYVDILVATPGRLIDFVHRKEVYLDRVETLVLDEADRMLDMGFIPQVKQIVRVTPHKEHRQTLFFSATFTQDIINLAQQWTLEPAKVEIEPETVATEAVDQQFYMVADSDKLKLLIKLLGDDSLGQTIIFANRRDQTQRLYDRLKKAGVKVGILTGDVAQNKRTKTLDDFKQGKIKFLIGTDVVGRGIHIDGITHVINFNLPDEPENYVHRIGRTGRAGASGVAISLIGEEDAYVVAELERLLGNKLTMQLPPEHLL